MQLSAALSPRDERDLSALLEAATAASRPVELFGTGTLGGFGAPVSAAQRVALDRFAGIAFYEPNELVLSAACGTPRAEIMDRVRQAGQILAFEPPDWAPLFGAPAGSGTLGGMVATNLSGPRRFVAGAARDHVLGLRGVNGRGEAFKTGGRVVKNVTGYDLCKLLTGSFGTLAALTEITLKTTPAPEDERTLVVEGLDPAAAVAAMAEAMATPTDPSGAAYLPGALGEDPCWGEGLPRSAVLLRVEGFAPSVAARIEVLARPLGVRGPVAVLGASTSAALWKRIADLAPFVARPELLVWRLSVPPAAAAAVLERVSDDRLERAWFDWAGGLVWLGLRAGEVDGGAARIRDAIRPHGGHATLLRAPVGLRAAVPVFEPEAAPVTALARRIRAGFDPAGILNPGRMGPRD